MNGKKYAYTLFLSTLTIFLTSNVFSNSIDTKKDLIKIVVNNIPSDADSDLMLTGGFSAWIEANNRILLFDTGGDNLSLLENIKKLNLDINKLDAVFISHNHWDHVYGLPGIMRLTGNKPDVYVPENSYEAIKEQNPRASIIPIKTQYQIYPGIWSTGQFKTSVLNTVIYEQSMIIEQNDSIYVITGCGHPGIIKIIEKVKLMFPEKSIALLAGGFHQRDYSEEEIKVISSKLVEMGVKAIAPSHCTGRTATMYFMKAWNNNYKSLNLGDKFILKTLPKK